MKEIWFLLMNMEETLSYLALEGWSDVDCAKVFNLLSTTDNVIREESTPRYT
jgi:hypothetical protein